MKARKSLNVRFTALCALMLMASACSTVPPPSPTVKVSPQLLAEPPRLPLVQRDSDGAMTGSQCHTSLTGVYDVAGQIRATLIELQKEARIAGCAGR